jgi:hypothetical protein
VKTFGRHVFLTPVARRSLEVGEKSGGIAQLFAIGSWFKLELK